MKEASDPPAPVLSYARWGVTPQDLIWVLGLSYTLFAVLLTHSSYVAVMPFIQDEWSLSNTAAGTLFSVTLAGYGLGSLLVVPMTDRIGPKPILLSMATVSVVSHLLFPLAADGIVSASVLRAFQGVGFVGVYAPGVRILAERFPARGRGLAVGCFVTASYASAAASMIFTGALMSAMDWRPAYLVVSAASATGLPVAFALLRGYGGRPSVVGSGGLDVTVLKNRPVVLIILGYALHAAEMYIGRVWLPAFLLATLVARGTAETSAAVVAATVAGAAMAAGAFGPIIGGAVSDRYGRMLSASAIFALSGLSLVALGWLFSGPWGLIIAVAVVFGWSSAADSAIYSTAITEVADPARLGSTMAIQAFIGFGFGVVGPIAFGGVLDLIDGTHRWGVGFTATGLLAVVAIVVLMKARALPRSRRMAGGRR